MVTNTHIIAYNPIISKANVMDKKMKRTEYACSSNVEQVRISTHEFCHAYVFQQLPFRCCIFICNFSRAAHIVPVPLAAMTKGVHTSVNGQEDGSAFRLAYDMWIKRPAIAEEFQDSKEWHLIVKEANAYTLFYYTTKIVKQKDCGYGKEYVEKFYSPKTLMILLSTWMMRTFSKYSKILKWLFSFRQRNDVLENICIWYEPDSDEWSPRV